MQGSRHQLTRDGKPVELKDASAKPLFPEEGPSENDIEQRLTANCYFLAALTAIAAKPNRVEIINQIIREIPTPNGPPLVLVRFFNPDTGEPRYIQITKEIENSRLYSGGALWVQLLEKAYILAFCGGDCSEFGKGGSMGVVLSHIIGEPYRQKDIHNSNSDVLYTIASLFEPQFINFAQRFFVLSPDEVTLWLQFVKKHSLDEDWKSEVKHQEWTVDHSKQTVVQKDDSVHVFRLEDFEKLLNKASTPAEKTLAGKILENVRAASMLPMKRGTGVYSAEENAIYDIIEKNAKHISVSTTTRTKITGKSGIVPTVPSVFTGGVKVQIYKGLASWHTCAVLGVKSVTMDDGRVIKFVKIRNSYPHGRSYKEKTGSTALKAYTSTEPEFYLELTDFCKRMTSIELVGCYVSFINTPGKKYMPGRVPAYILASDGLYFVTKEGAITDQNLITKDPAKLDKLKTVFKIDQLPVDKTYVLNVEERMQISEITRSNLAEEKVLSETRGTTLYTKSSTDISAMNFDRLPAYLLTANGLYHITEDAAGKAKHNQVIKDPFTIQWLWHKLTDNLVATDTTFVLTNDANYLKDKSKYRSELFITQALNNNDYNFENMASPDMTLSAYMKDYNLSSQLIKLFVSGLQLLFHTNDPKALNDLFTKISPAQMQGLANLKIRFNNATISGTCFELAEKLNSSVAKYSLDFLFPPRLNFRIATAVASIQTDGNGWTVLERYANDPSHEVKTTLVSEGGLFSATQPNKKPVKRTPPPPPALPDTTAPQQTVPAQSAQLTQNTVKNPLSPPSPKQKGH